MTAPERSFTVSQIGRAIGAALEESFPEAFWVTGEIQGFDRDAAKAGTRRWGQVYFELVEKEPGTDTVRAGIKALLWGDAHAAAKAKLAAVSPDLRLQDGLQVRLLCRVDFYWPRASLQLKVLDLDPHFTLGDMERARRELVEALKAQGLFDQNRSRPWPVPPLNVGLVTSEGSAAYHDFVHELARSGYAFRVRFMDARMQGAEAERDVPRAVSLLSRDPAVDLVAIVRGGGSRSDLIWFDKERIARAVATCPKPVLTGIGHEIDLSVADLVAHTARKTPTAAAGCLIEGVRAFEEGLNQAWSGIGERSVEILERQDQALKESAHAWRRMAAAGVARWEQGLGRSRERLRSGAQRVVAVARERMTPAGPRLRAAWGSFHRGAAERLEAARRECELKDPRRVLERGYSLIYAGGRLARGIGDIRPGEFIEGRLRDGRLTANVLAARKE